MRFLGERLRTRVVTTIVMIVALPVIYGLGHAISAFWQRASVEASFVVELGELAALKTDQIDLAISPSNAASAIAEAMAADGIDTADIQIVVYDEDRQALSSWAGSHAEENGNYQRATDVAVANRPWQVELTVFFNRWSWLDRTLVFGVLVPVLMLVLMTIAAWLAFDFVISRHLRALVERVDGYRRTGSWEAPRHSKAAPVEFKVLYDSFHAMADEARSREIHLAEALDASEDALRELHHRVRNNLQVILSLVSMRQRSATSEDVDIELSSLSRRMHVIVLAHRDPVIDIAAGQATVAPYLTSLIRQFRHLASNPELRLGDNSVADEQMPIDRLVPLGLFIVEWLEQPNIRTFDGMTLSRDEGQLCIVIIVGIEGGFETDFPMHMRLLLDQCDMNPTLDQHECSTASMRLVARSG